MKRNELLVYLNGEEKRIAGKEAFLTLADWLRYEEGKTGTKIVCAEGDCGACTVLVAKYNESNELTYLPINSCITYPYLLDCSHIVTVEGIGERNNLDPIQESMVKNHGAQCGYCTPGFICSMAGMVEDLKANKQKITEKKVKNHLTGNLCRCTGYLSILDSVMKLKTDKVKRLKERFNEKAILKKFSEVYPIPVFFNDGKKSCFLPKTFDEAVDFLSENKSSIVSGSTDLGVFANKGKINLKNLMSLNNVEEAYKIKNESDHLLIGAKASLTSVESACDKVFPEFSRMLHIFASPQIKNKGTLVGNIANGSPIGDTIPFLMVAEASLVIRGKTGQRELNINDFYLGYKKFAIEGNEIITHVKIPKTKDHFKLYKVSTRKDLDISTVTFAGRLKLKNKKVESISLALGGVGPVVIRPKKLEESLKNSSFSIEVFKDKSNIIDEEITPLSDLRGSKDFRLKLCKNLLKKFQADLAGEIL